MLIIDPNFHAEKSRRNARPHGPMIRPQAKKMKKWYWIFLPGEFIRRIYGIAVLCNVCVCLCNIWLIFSHFEVSRSTSFTYPSQPWLKRAVCSKHFYYPVPLWWIVEVWMSVLRSQLRVVRSSYSYPPARVLELFTHFVWANYNTNLIHINYIFGQWWILFYIQ